MAALTSILRWSVAILLWTVVALCLLVTVVPRYLDRVYYRGDASAHFDGTRFFNPDGGDIFEGVSRGRAGSMITRAIFGDPTRPAWPTAVRVLPSKPPARVEGGAMLVTWVGHATMLVQADGVNILTDPVWSDTAGPLDIGPRRVAEPGVRFDDLPKIDIVLISHNHYDHMDLTTLRRLWDRDRPLIATSLGNDAILRSAGIEARALDWGGSVALPTAHDVIGATDGCVAIWCGQRAAVVATRNHHWGSRWFTDRNRALWSSFIVQLPHGNFFFAGDTGIGDGKWPAEAAKLGPIRLAAIPVGAFRFEEGQMGSDSHIGPWDAIRVWNGLGRPQAIPIHWGTFRLSWEGYRTPVRLLDAMLHCAGETDSRFAMAKIGQPVAIAAVGGTPPAPDMKGIDRCNQAGAFAALR